VPPLGVVEMMDPEGTELEHACDCPPRVRFAWLSAPDADPAGEPTRFGTVVEV
jgi:hypothetical protein